MDDLKSKKILIVGASSGIGLALAKTLANHGAELYTASRHESDELKKLNTNFQAWDVTTDEPLEGLPDTLEGVVYCPGTINLKPFQALKPDDYRKDWEINFMGAVKTLQASMKSLRKSENASVVLFSTVAVKVGINFHASIAAAKAAVEGLARSLAAEWASKKIRVNVIAPSLTDTPLAGNLLNTDEKKASSEKRHPLGFYGAAEDISSMATFLLSEQSRWVTGQVIQLDGGISGTRPL